MFGCRTRVKGVESKTKEAIISSPQFLNECGKTSCLPGKNNYLPKTVVQVSSLPLLSGVAEEFRFISIEPRHTTFVINDFRQNL